MSTRTQLKRLERAHQRTRQARDTSISVYFAGNDYAIRDGERITLAEHNALRKAGNTVIEVRYNESREKVTDFMSAQGVSKQYINVSPLDWDN